MVEKEEFYLNSTNGVNKLHVILWHPLEEIRAIVQISHGMCEYVDRYDRLATFLAQHGMMVIGNDHLGHGETAKGEEELGYFPKAKGSETVVDDLYKVTKSIRARYPRIPYFLLGHSMGSFMARRYLMTYGSQLDGAILMGTAKTTANSLSVVRGEHHRSQLMMKMAFGSYNKQYPSVRTEYDWLSRNDANVDTYLEDPYCGFMFTLNGYKVLFDVLSACIVFVAAWLSNKKHPVRSFTRGMLPLLFVAGSDDPVGHFGKDVPEICRIYREAGVKNVEMKIYPGDRHEILNELDYEQVQMDILSFIEKRLEALEA